MIISPQCRLNGADDSNSLNKVMTPISHATCMHVPFMTATGYDCIQVPYNIETVLLKVLHAINTYTVDQ